MNWFHLMTVILAVAKLAGYFPHSWWLVFTPSIVAVGLGLLLMLVALVGIVILEATK